MNMSTDTFEKFTKRKTHESDNLGGRKNWKKHSYSTIRGMKRKCEE